MKEHESPRSTGALRTEDQAKTQALAAMAAQWRGAGPAHLTAGLADWLLEALEGRLRLDPEAGVRAAREALPPGWPEAGLGAGIGLFDRLEGDCLAAFHRHGALDVAGVRAVHDVFSEARAALATQGGQRPLSVHQALAARDRQLSVATHELRTPISSILLNLELLERTARTRGSLDHETVQQLLAVPARQLRRLTHMVDLLLDTARVESERLVLNREPVDLCHVIQDAVARLGEMARHAGCQLDVKACQPVIGQWDRLRLEQVVTNLVTNAIKYGGGHIEVSTQGGEEATFSVRDRGSGIADEDQQRIFEPFERLAHSAKEDGAGLGLYIVREIVRSHGGRVSVDSRPGAGATFTVYLPLSQQELSL